jgi:hypothetical protein
MPPPTISWSTLQDGQLGRHLGARDDGHQRTRWRCQCLGDGIDLGRQQRAGAGGLRVLGNTVGRAFGAVGRAKGVIHIDVAQPGQLLRQRGQVFLFADIGAAVLQHHDLAGCHVDAIDPVGDQRHFAAQQLAQALGDGGERVLRLEGAFGGAAQVAGHHHGGAGLQRHLDRRDRRTHARVFGDLARAVERHIQIGADENALALHLALGTQVGETKDVHENGYQRV